MDLNSMLPGLLNGVNGDQDQTSLLQAIAAYQQMLAGNQQATNQLGVNPQILQAQQGVDLSRVNAAQSILNQPLGQTGQPWIQNPDSPYNAQLQGLLSRGPDMSGVSGGINKFGFDPSAGQRQAALNQHNQQVDAARLGAFFDTKILSPAEQQQRDNMAQAGQLDQASGILAGTKPQPGVDPNDLAKFGAILGQQMSASTKAKGDVAAAGLGALSTENVAKMNLAKAGLDAQGNLSVQKLKNEGDLAVATAKATKDATELAPAVRAKYQEQVLGLTKMGQDMSQMAKLWEPGFGNDIFKTQLELSNLAAKKGINYKVVGINPQQLDNYHEFQRGIDQIVVDAKNLVNDKTSARKLDTLKATLFDPKAPPEAQRNALVNILTENQINKELHMRVLNAGLTNNKDVGDLGSALSQQITPEQRKAIQDRIVQEHPNLAPISPHTTGVGGQPIKPGSAPTQAGAQAALIARQQALAAQQQVPQQ